jgi:pimeloyl-ACP methyl ester carboxylesterase
MISRRGLLQASLAILTPAAVRAQALGQVAVNPPLQPLDPAVLPRGVRSRFVDNVNGIRMHVLECGYEAADRPGVLLLHGFPELAYSWRKVMPALAAAGFHVMAPDVRGYGRSGGADATYDDDLRPFQDLNKVRDVLALVFAFGHQSVAVVGHDQGSSLAGWCALARPDVFRSVVMMSAPFVGAPSPQSGLANATSRSSASPDPDRIYEELAALTPPRQHYRRYYATRGANENLWHAPQGIHAFLRAYYHMKSADWKQNQPHPLAGRTAAEWAKLPRYYVMDLGKGMAETVAPEMPSAAAIAANRWLPDAELRVYSEEFGRTGFQGGLNYYRTGVDPEAPIFAGRNIDVPATFIGGKSDWGVYQNPGALERLESTICTNYRGTHLVDGAGHWVQQEQPDQVSRLILDFLRTTKA